VDVDALRNLVRELAHSPGPERADRLVGSLATTRPSPELARFISDTLEHKALHEIRDSAGVSLRWRLVDRLLSLGFPHALLVAPLDLEYHSTNGGVRTTWLSALVLVSSLSIACNLPIAGLMFFAGPGLGLHVLGMLPLVHSIAALVTGLRIKDRKTGETALRVLGLAVFATPIAMLGGNSLDGAMICLGLPSTLTAVLCAVVARALSAPMAPLPAVSGIADQSHPAARVASPRTSTLRPD
jgi:hypothetical protein